NDLVKNQALEIAKKHCGVPVVDKLQVHGTLTFRAPAGPTDELQRGAAALLAEGFGAAASGLHVRATAQGQLVVSGACDSYEEKVAVSKKLRGLHGCCSVDNHLTVKPVVRDGRLVALVTADGSYTVQGVTDGMPIQ